MNRLTPRVDLFPKVTNLRSPPVVGQTYAVPCYRQEAHVVGQAIQGATYLPVYLPAHEDGELLSFPVWHYHVDHRFMSDGEVESRYRQRVQLRGDEKPRSPDLRRSLADSLDLVHTNDGTPDYASVWWKPMVCYASEQRTTASLPALVTHFRDKPLSCLRCPHKGVNLADIAPDRWGHVTCPAHGLRWNVRTGRSSHAYAYKRSISEWLRHVSGLMPRELRRQCGQPETREGAESLVLSWLLREIMPRPSLFPVGFKATYRHWRRLLPRDTVWMGFAVAIKDALGGDSLASVHEAYAFWHRRLALTRVAGGVLAEETRRLNEVYERDAMENERRAG